MAQNPYVNKVVFGNDTLVDLTEDSVTASNLLEGETAHNAAGAPVTGTAKQGHVIVNASGEDMMQRAKLKFVDADVTDDSTGKKTEISVVRKLTQAEFDELTPEEQNRGVIVIKDANPIYVPSNNAVSVTADGVKTYSQLLDELYALIDKTKITRNTVLVRYISDTTLVYHLRYATNNMLIVDFAGVDISSANNVATQTFTITSSGSTYKVMSAGAYSDNSTAVPSSGTTYALYYNILPSVEVEEDYLTVSIAGLASTNQNSTTGLYYAVVDLSARIPEGNEITAVNAMNNFDCFYYMPNGRRLIVCSPQSYSLSASVTRDLRVWYRKL